MERWRENTALNVGQPVPRSAIKEYGFWRKRVGRDVTDALGLYARYCVGQFAGMGEALNLEAVRFACEAEAIPRSRWAEVVEESQIIHRIAVAHSKEKPASGR